METMDEALLRGEFSASSYEEWRKAAEALLKGAPFEKKMLTRTPEGITLQPIYRKEDAAALTSENDVPGAGDFMRGSRAEGYLELGWEIAQEQAECDPKAFNEKLLKDLMTGQTAVNARLDAASQLGLDPSQATAGQVGVKGVSLARLADLEAALEQVVPEAVGLHFQSGLSGVAVAAFLKAWVDANAYGSETVRGSLNMDPLAFLAETGSLPVAIEQYLDEMSLLVKYNETHLPEVSAIGVSVLPCNAAGASAVEELAAALAAGVFYIRSLCDRGCTVDQVARQIRFTFPIGSDFFMEVAKLRVARKLWARVVKELGGEGESLALKAHGRTGLFNKTKRDPYVNMLRTTTEALAAVVGGVDSLEVAAFDETLRLPNDFARRIARNTQVILQEECDLTAVVDPAGGSWYIENLSEELGKKAWDAFKAIESQGGILEALKSGSLQGTIAEARAFRKKGLGARRVSLIGTNKYPNIQEKLLEAEAYDAESLLQARVTAVPTSAPIDLIDSVEAAVEAAKQGASLGAICQALRSKAGESIACEPLPKERLAQEYETMRDAAEAYRAKAGILPQIYLANIGPLRRHKPRADFTRAFFEAGGFEMIMGEGSNEAAEVANAAVASKAPIVVVCGTDPDYEEKLVSILQSIKGKGASVKLILAGFPGEKEAEYKAAGLDDYIFVKSDNYNVNRKYLEMLGVL